MKFPVVTGQRAKILTFMFLAERLNGQPAMPFVQGTLDSQTAHELAMDFAFPMLAPRHSGHVPPDPGRSRSRPRASASRAGRPAGRDHRSGGRVMRGPESYIVTLPLTEEQGRAAVVAQHNTPPCIASELAAMVRAVGVPVGAGELEDVCALAWKLPDTVDSIIVFKTAQEARERGWPDSQITSAVLRTDAEARIAALNAENGRLREAARSLLTDWEDFTGDRESIGRNATRSALSAAHTPAGRSDAEMLAWVARRGVKIIPPALHIMGMWVIQADSGISLGTGLSPAAAIATAMNRETRPNA